MSLPRRVIGQVAFSIMVERSLWRAIVFFVTACGLLVADELPTLPGFQAIPERAEQVRWQHGPAGVRTYIQAPLPLSHRPRTLIVFATPNGNSIEHTLGCQMTEGLDWHYNIQHVAAQVRYVRARDEQHDWVLAVTDCPQRSWPSFCRAEPNAARKIRDQVEQLMRETGCDSLVLACHSGGGGFVFGFIESFAAARPIGTNCIPRCQRCL